MSPPSEVGHLFKLATLRATTSGKIFRFHIAANNMNLLIQPAFNILSFLIELI